MTTKLREEMASGVFVEFRDATGNTTGQALYTDWQGRPVPAIGDCLVCDVRSATGSGKLAGRVVARQFEVQREPDGTASLWVMVIAQSNSRGPRGQSSRMDVSFSRN